MAKLIRQISILGRASVHKSNYGYHMLVQGQNQILRQLIGSPISSSETLSYSTMPFDVKEKDPGVIKRLQIGENISRKEKMKILLDTLLDTKDSKEAIYGALDAYVAWEQNFPIGQLKNVLITLEKEQQWHRVIQVIKWMLSKGQGNTMNTYGQLIRALDMDHRVDEAHEIWVKKIGNDLHSVPWKLGKCMMFVYYRSKMMEKVVNLFKGFEAFDRKPPEKSIVQIVANAYEILGRIEERDRVLEKYNSLFLEKESSKKLDRKKKKQRPETTNA